MSKKIILIFLLIILLLNKIILSQVILIGFKKWLDKDIIVQNIDISYQNGDLTLRDIKVFEKKDSRNLLLFFADEIYIDFDLNSLFSTLIVIKNMNISNAKLYLNFETSKNNEIINDNLSILDNLKNKDPKIYPEKLIDINFLIKKSKIINTRIGIVENNKKKLR